MATAYHQTLTQTSQQPHTAEQLSLPFPIQAAPPIVRAHGLRDTHSFPLVARAKGESFRVSPLQAWHFLLLEIRAGNSYPLLTLDCDGPASVQAFWLTQLNSELPEPNWVVQNPATGNLAAVLVPGQTPCIAAKPPARRRCTCSPAPVSFSGGSARQIPALWAVYSATRCKSRIRRFGAVQRPLRCPSW